jgi:hypothetical protein
MQGPFIVQKLALKGYLGSEEGQLHGIGCFRWLRNNVFFNYNS